MVPATPAMPTHHHREQARRGQRGEIGPDDQRRFGLADEDVRRGGERFDPADPGHPADRAADPAHDPLHDPEIIEDRDQAREEDDHRQSGDREGVGERVRVARPEQEFGALGGIAEQVGDAGRQAIGSRPGPSWSTARGRRSPPAARRPRRPRAGGSPCGWSTPARRAREWRRSRQRRAAFDSAP